MTADEVLDYESRTKMRQAAIAGLAGILLVGAAAIQLTGTQSKVNELTLGLITEHKRYPLDLVGAIINGIGLCLVAWTLSYLFSISRARNEQLRTFIRPLAIAGGVLAAIAAVVYALEVASKADTFVSTGSQTYMEANHLTSGTTFVAVPLLGQLGALLLAVGFVLTALNAMRVGLLTKFMGYLGVFTGILVLFPIGSPVPIVQGFWLVAFAYLLTGHWPSGLPQAWTTGKAERWPSSQEIREERLRAREAAGSPRGGGARGGSGGPRGGGGRAGGGGGGLFGGFMRPRPDPPSKPAAKEQPTASPTPTSRTRSTTPKRKRKRRH